MVSNTSPTKSGHFRLLDLPPELRLNIYFHYFKGAMQCIHCPASHSTNPSALLLANKQINNESMELFYKLCIFSMRHGPTSWFMGIPPRWRNTITSIQLWDFCEVERFDRPPAVPFQQKNLVTQSEHKIRRAGGDVGKGVIRAAAFTGRCSEWVWVTAECDIEKWWMLDHA